MTVAAIAARAQGPGTPVRVQSQPSEGTPGPSEGPAFRDTLAQAVDRVDGAQKAADAQVEAFVAGETENVHDVMIALNQAELHFQLLTEVRNKLLDGYQELMRMQV
ncbi:flagellar hook-basal body complex protein FliE [Rubrivirga marina]|uniref:Flagellar hook-basal body complex protein FliE n=1 Tax=Rubrivirga marina TaxID=1196024 RepID=A0A271IX01_9BACT|nr:flagellar hook-basal body complex protein FliE [Rubrivirga marina]PAP75771.1 flagellar hook-basal body complex protein FliE [Rubrivirga marina]